MVIYQIVTEDLPDYRHTVERALMDNGFEEFTICHNALGYGPYQDGKPENSMMILVAILRDYVEQDVEERMMRVKDRIHEQNGPKGQEAVLLARYPADGKMHVRVALYSTDSGEWLVANFEHYLRGRKAEGRVVAAAGDWKRLLPKNAELRGKIVRFLPE
jgi:hypothetical protein